MKKSIIFKPNSRLKIMRIAAFIFSSSLALTFLSCYGENKKTEKAEPVKEKSSIERQDNRILIPEGSPLRERLKIEQASIQSIHHQFTATASVEADPARTAKVTPPLAGRIGKLFVHVSDTVQQGTPLLTIEAPDLASAQTDYLRAKTVLAQAERTLARQKDLADHGILGQKDVEQAETDRDSAKADLDRTVVRLKLLSINPKAEEFGGPLTVHSPISGRVLDLSVAPGEFRNDPNAVLMTIGDLSTVWVTANVLEKDIHLVHKGGEATATLAAYQGETFQGRILFVSDILDPDTRAVKVRIAFQNPNGRIKPGMFATVSFDSGVTEDIVVPTTSLVMSNERSTVFVEVAPWTFEQQTVETGEQQGAMTVLKSGIKNGARIVTEGGVLLQ